MGAGFVNQSVRFGDGNNDQVVVANSKGNLGLSPCDCLHYPQKLKVT